MHCNKRTHEHTDRRTLRKTNSASLTPLLILLKNIYTLWGCRCLLLSTTSHFYPTVQRSSFARALSLSRFRSVSLSLPLLLPLSLSRFRCNKLTVQLAQLAQSSPRSHRNQTEPRSQEKTQIFLTFSRFSRCFCFCLFTFFRFFAFCFFVSCVCFFFCICCCCCCCAACNLRL